MEPVPEPRPRDLTREELIGLVQDLAARSELWASRVRHEPDRRTYEELLRDEHVAVWLICWMNDHDTGFHDHDVSAGAVAVVRGAVREERLRLGAAPARRVVGAGPSFTFGPPDIHRGVHHRPTPAAPAHAYSPPLRRMGPYEV